MKGGRSCSKSQHPSPLVLKGDTHHDRDELTRCLEQDVDCHHLPTDLLGTLFSQVDRDDHGSQANSETDHQSTHHELNYTWSEPHGQAADKEQGICDDDSQLSAILVTDKASKQGAECCSHHGQSYDKPFLRVCYEGKAI